MFVFEFYCSFLMQNNELLNFALKKWVPMVAPAAAGPTPMLKEGETEREGRVEEEEEDVEYLEELIGLEWLDEVRT